MQDTLKEIKDIGIIKSSIETLKVEIEQLKQMNSNQSPFVLLQKNLSDLDKNMWYLNQQLDKKVDKEVFEEIETTFYSVHSEHKIIQKKLQVVEEMLINNRSECFNQVNDLEKFFVSKNENIKQAICHLCRNLKVTNPLI